MKDLLAWWFSPKQAKRVSFIIKLLIGVLIVFSFFSTLIGNTIDLINAHVKPPPYLSMSYLLLPITFTLFTKAVFWGGLFYLPYYIFGKRSSGKKRYLIPILLASLIIGSVYAAGLYTKPGIVEITRTQLALLEARLGEINKMGEFYTLREFSYDIAELTEPVPDFFINEAEGFSKLVIFHKDCEKEWEAYDVLPLDMESSIAIIAERLYGSDGYLEARVLWLQYDELPSTPTSVRTEYRVAHPEVDASLLFWGESTSSVFRKGTEGWEQVSNLLLTWFNDYRIDQRMHPAFADWTLLQK